MIKKINKGGVYITVYKYISFLLFEVIKTSVIFIVFGFLYEKFLYKLFNKNRKYLFVVIFLFLVYPITNSIIHLKNVEKVNLQYEILKENSSIWAKNFFINTNQFLKNNIRYNNVELFKLYAKIIIYLWIAISIFKIIQRLTSYFYVKNLFGNELVEDENIIKLLNECKKELSIKKNIKIIKQASIKTPAIIGIFDVKILLNDYVLNLDQNTIKYVLMHELSHYKRKDNIMNFIVLIFKSIHFFNPFLKRVFNNIRRNIEIATDEMATKNMNFEEKKEYCKTIVKIAGICSVKTELVLGLIGDYEILEERINLISGNSKVYKKSKYMEVILVVIGILIFGIYCYNNITQMNDINLVITSNIK